MIIGDVAKLTGVSAKMIRHYESIGLIKPALRSDAGYRQYREQDVHVLRFIRRARDLGFSLDAIKVLLTLWLDKTRHSADVKQIASQHIDELQLKIAALQDMVTTLQTLVQCCAGDERPECPILENFSTIGEMNH
jgi:MerR family gold-responsive transcriptional activator of gol and ges genes